MLAKHVGRVVDAAENSGGDDAKKLLTADEVRERLRAACANVGSLRKWGIANGINPPVLTEILQGKKAVSKTVSRALGLRRLILWQEVDEHADSL